MSEFIIEIENKLIVFPGEKQAKRFPTLDAAKEFCEGYSDQAGELDFDTEPKTDHNEARSWSATDDDGVEYLITES